MPRYYYGTVPALAWIINHYFYARTHYAWLADAFHPHRDNPGSSNPYKIYGQLYEPWVERDRYARFVVNLRTSLGEGVTAKERSGLIDNITAARLRRVCVFGSIDLFYPLLYRVNIERIAQSRQIVDNSGLEGSHEVLVADLREKEFELLFADNQRDEYFAQIVLRELEGEGRTDRLATLALLETKVVS